MPIFYNKKRRFFAWSSLSFSFYSNGGYPGVCFLCQALLSSCFIPIFSGWIPPHFHGVRYIDGCYSDNLPILDENTVTVSPFCGESDICPRDDTYNVLQVCMRYKHPNTQLLRLDPLYFFNSPREALKLVLVLLMFLFCDNFQVLNLFGFIGMTDFRELYHGYLL